MSCALRAGKPSDAIDLSAGLHWPIRTGFMPHASALPLAQPSPLRTEFRALVALAVPLAGANLIQMIVYAVDVIFGLRLGAENLSACASRNGRPGSSSDARSTSFRPLLS